VVKIKLAILDRDVDYLDRIEQIAASKWNDRIEMYSVTDESKIYDFVKKNFIDVLLIDKSIETDNSRFSDRVAVAYLSDSNDIATYKGIPAVGKYQKAELIYKSILSLYADAAEGDTTFRESGTASIKSYAFTSIGGGAGSSTLAASFAIKLAEFGRRVLYLNFEALSSTNDFFNAAGSGDFSDILDLIVNERPGFESRVESVLKRSSHGVYFFDPFKYAIEAEQLTGECVEKMLTGLSKTELFDVFVIDYGFSFSELTYSILKKANRNIFVSDASEQSNCKLAALKNALQIYQENNEKYEILNGIRLIYNKSDAEANGRTDIFSVLDTLPVFEAPSPEYLARALSKHGVWDALIAR